jgi:hypothetical protein
VVVLVEFRLFGLFEKWFCGDKYPRTGFVE